MNAIFWDCLLFCLYFTYFAFVRTPGTHRKAVIFINSRKCKLDQVLEALADLSAPHRTGSSRTGLSVNLGGVPSWESLGVPCILGHVH